MESTRNVVWNVSHVQLGERPPCMAFGKSRSVHKKTAQSVFTLAAVGAICGRSASCGERLAIVVTKSVSLRWSGHVHWTCLDSFQYLQEVRLQIWLWLTLNFGLHCRLYEKCYLNKVWSIEMQRKALSCKVSKGSKELNFIVLLPCV